MEADIANGDTRTNHGYATPIESVIRLQKRIKPADNFDTMNVSPTAVTSPIRGTGSKNTLRIVFTYYK